MSTYDVIEPGPWDGGFTKLAKVSVGKSGQAIYIYYEDGSEEDLRFTGSHLERRVTDPSGDLVYIQSGRMDKTDQIVKDDQGKKICSFSITQEKTISRYYNSDPVYVVDGTVLRIRGEKPIQLEWYCNENGSRIVVMNHKPPGYKALTEEQIETHNYWCARYGFERKKREKL